MRLREEAVYVRLSTFQDLLMEGAALRAVALVEDALGLRLRCSQDRGARRRERALAPIEGLGALEALVGQGLHVAGHVRLLSAPDPEVMPWLALVAGPHPYTGRYRVALDLRVPRALAQGEAAARRLAALLEALCALCQPATAHAHDADDNSAQNITDPNLLRRGFGVEPPEDPMDRPGAEVNLGELCYVVNWLTVLGPEQVEDLGGDAHIAATPAPEVRPLGAGRWWVRLYDDPLDAAAPAQRAVQRAVAAHWALPALAKAQGPTLAYWSRRSWRTDGAA